MPDFAIWLLKKCLLPFWLIVTSPPVLLFAWLTKHDEGFRGAALLIVPLIFAWFFGSLWLAMTTARHMFEENRMFLSAIKHTLHDLRLRMTFLPLIGHWFTRSGDNRDVSDDED